MVCTAAETVNEVVSAEFDGDIRANQRVRSKDLSTDGFADNACSDFHSMASSTHYFQLAPLISREEMQAFVEDVAERFHPLRVILFGSYAYGEPPDADSHVICWYQSNRRGLRCGLR